MNINKETYFELNLENSFAKIVSSKSKGTVFIPCSLNHNTKEFIIKTISKESFFNNIYLKSVKFLETSEIENIE